MRKQTLSFWKFILGRPLTSSSLLSWKMNSILACPNLLCHNQLLIMHAWKSSIMAIIFWHIYSINIITMDPHPIHQPARLIILKVKGKVGFRVLKNSSQWGMILFGFATYFLFLFLNGENLSKNKNPSMTPVRKKWSAKTRFWVRGSGYLSRRYLTEVAPL